MNNNLYMLCRAIELTNKIYICCICDKTFTKKYNRNTHLLIHMNIKLYKCNICKRSFSREGNLRRHRKYCYKQK